MDKRFLAILGVVIAVFVGLLIWNPGKDSKTTTAAKPSNHIYGKADSKVYLLEYGDFQCNACVAYAPVTEAVRAKYADKVKFQFRHLPLASAHPNAIGAARAAEAAGKQGKFWEMHDLLYKESNWSVWSTSTNPNTYFESYARQLSLNIDKFNQDFKSKVANDTINADIAEFEKHKVQKATPSFFLNGKSIKLEDIAGDSGPSADKLGAILDKALAEADKNQSN